MLFYDYEVTRFDWMVVVIEITLDTYKVNEFVNDREGLYDFYTEHKHEIWVGFNNRNYDQYIMKSVLIDMDPWKMNEWIISRKNKGWQYPNDLLKSISFINYDVMPNPPVGLKTLEGFMGSNIKETDVPFDIDRPMTKEEINQMLFYCRHDVEETVKVFLESKSNFDAMMGIVEAFGLPLSAIGKTEAQITAQVLDCKRREAPKGKKRYDVYDLNGYIDSTLAVSERQAVNNIRHKYDGDEPGKNDQYRAVCMEIGADEYDYEFLPCLQISKYKEAVEWFRNAKADCIHEMEEAGLDWEDEYTFRNRFYKRSMTMDVAGVPHTFGWGGLHGAPDKPVYYSGYILHVDVGSYYPSMLIAWDMVTRTATNQNYKGVYDTRMALKAAGKKKEQAPYKKLLNALSGAMKDKHNPAYDPRMNNQMCVNGQLMLLDLIEHLEVIPGFELIQSNTDGLIIYIPDTDEAFQMADDICYDWEMRCSTDKCKILLSLDTIREIYQKDVNNYLWVDFYGGVERKGAYVKELSPLDYDLPIINKAMVEYMVHRTPVEDTINGCDKIIEFQKIVKLSSAYKYVEHEYGESHWEPKYTKAGKKSGKQLVYEHAEKFTYKAFRVFASADPKDGRLVKCRPGQRAKFGNTPDKCFICNDDVTEMKVPETLDRQWYIDLAKDRLRQFGLEVT